MGHRGGGEIDVHAILQRPGFRDGKDVDADGDGVGIDEALSSRLVTSGSSVETLQPSASAQNRPSAESSRAFIAI